MVRPSSPMPHTNAFRLPQWTGFFLAAVLAPLVSGTSDASCGNYVHISPPQTIDAHARENSHDGDSHRQDAPCRGPNCSRRQDRVPAPIPAPPPSPTFDHAAWLAIIRVILPDESDADLSIASRGIPADSPPDSNALRAFPDPVPKPVLATGRTAFFAFQSGALLVRNDRTGIRKLREQSGSRPVVAMRDFTAAPNEASPCSAHGAAPRKCFHPPKRGTRVPRGGALIQATTIHESRRFP